MKRIAILGSTGSIGVNTLNVARHLHNAIEVVALAAHSNIDLIEQQAREFNPKLIAIYDEKQAVALAKRLPHIPVVAGMEGVIAAATFPDATMVVSAMSGTLGLQPTVAAIQARKTIALANKEALVSGGALVMRLAKENGVSLIPIDSEHSALFQCLNGEDPASIHRLIITASGGPFRTLPQEKLNAISVDQALCHPTYRMGPKITIDSSTLMNKGLEVIEAHWLFQVPVEKIEVVVHPQSIIHSMVEFVDNSIMAQLSEPMMITPIQYALTYPKRAPTMLAPFDFTQARTLEFSPPDFSRFRCLALAFDAIREGGTLPCTLNAANEVLVHRFLNREIGWTSIADKLQTLLDRHHRQEINTLEDILAADKDARALAKLE